MKRHFGFTLIELLIVVAIIAILAAIAVPNFLEAQTRSKVTRQLANMRTTATALEAYYVDNNHLPMCTVNCGSVTNPFGSWTAQEQWKFYPGFAGRAGGLTTPIAYITSAAAMEDIFRLPLNFGSSLAEQIMYLPSEHYSTRAPYAGCWSSPTTMAAQERVYGAWVMRSAGPDNYYQNIAGERADYGAGPSGWNRASYDATNGTLSGGDIQRSQKFTVHINAYK